MQVITQNDMIIVKYDWKQKREEKRQMHREFVEFIRGMRQ